MVKKAGSSSKRTGVNRGRRSRLGVIRRVRRKCANARSRESRSAPEPPMAGPPLPGSSASSPCIPQPVSTVTSLPSPLMAGVDYIIPPPSGFEDAIPTLAGDTWMNMPTEGLSIHENYAHKVILLHELDVSKAVDEGSFSESVTSVTSPPSPIVEGVGYIIPPPPGFQNVIPRDAEGT